MFSGIILSGNEISQILLSLILTYFGGQRNRPRWIAWGVVFSAMSCFILAWPHFIYGAGEEALQYTKEYLEEHKVNLGFFCLLELCLMRSVALLEHFVTDQCETDRF